MLDDFSKKYSSTLTDSPGLTNAISFAIHVSVYLCGPPFVISVAAQFQAEIDSLLDAQGWIQEF